MHCKKQSLSRFPHLCAWNTNIETISQICEYCVVFTDDLIADLQQQREVSSMNVAPPPPDLPPEDDMDDEDVYDVPEEVRKVESLCRSPQPHFMGLC